MESGLFWSLVFALFTILYLIDKKKNRFLFKIKVQFEWKVSQEGH